MAYMATQGRDFEAKSTSEFGRRLLIPSTKRQDLPTESRFVHDVGRGTVLAGKFGDGNAADGQFAGVGNG